jgi:hypothetical protein
MRLGWARSSRYNLFVKPAIHDWAAKYIWWQTPEEAALRPRRVMAQVMDLGTFADVCDLEKVAGPDALADVIRHAEPGWFSPRSWHFWHRRLGLASAGAVPAMPVRRFA